MWPAQRRRDNKADLLTAGSEPSHVDKEGDAMVFADYINDDNDDDDNHAHSSWTLVFTRMSHVGGLVV